ncbi:sodium:solute symporter family protein [Amphibacillus sp. Q70]|uniref:sodium:solute symporter family protein n=1 Tax=Amphibacillus sp. Q70 TaxID=3453416 RepID=UPI003F859C68
MSQGVIISIYAVIFIAVLIGVGQYAKRWVSETSDFIIAGREISTPINMVGVIAIGFAGTSITLAPGFSVLYGLRGGITWGVLYAGFGLILYGLIFSRFARLSGAQTLPEYFEMRYSREVRTFVAITSVIGMTGILANNIVSLTNIVGGYTGWPTWAITGVAFLVILFFATSSGMWATTLTDFIQVSIGTIGVPIFLLMLLHRFGGIDFIANNWTGYGHDWINNGISGQQIPMLSWKYPSALTFILNFGAALVWGNNYYWIKLSNCRNEKVAKKSFTYGGIYLIIFFMIPLSFIGLFAGADTPELFTVMGGEFDQTSAYGMIANVITPLLGSLFIISAAAASISTSSTSALGATSTATRDVYQQFNKDNDPKKTLKVSKWIMGFIIILTWLLTFFPGGPVYLFAFANAWLVPPAVLLLLGAIWPRFNSTGAKWGVIIGVTTMLLLTVLDLTNIFNINQYTHMAIVGFFVTLIVSVMISLFSKSKYYGEKNWEPKATNANRIEVKLNEFDRKVLDLIRLGHKYMANLTDGLEVDSKVTNASIEKLDQGGYIERKGLTWTNFYTFHLTEKGYSIFNYLTDQEKEMERAFVDQKHLNFLKQINENPKEMGVYAKENNMGSLQLSSVISHLVRKGYLIEKGLFKREVEITQLGKKLVSNYFN